MTPSILAVSAVSEDITGLICAETSGGRLALRYHLGIAVFDAGDFIGYFGSGTDEIGLLAAQTRKVLAKTILLFTHLDEFVFKRQGLLVGFFQLFADGGEARQLATFATTGRLFKFTERGLQLVVTLSASVGAPSRPVPRLVSVCCKRAERAAMRAAGPFGSFGDAARSSCPTLLERALIFCFSSEPPESSKPAGIILLLLA